MPKIAYKDWRPTGASRLLIRQAEAICEDYAAQGYSLTLRQLYYRLVASGVIDNNLRSYKRLGNVMNEARLAGHIDWLHLEDRHRNLAGGGGFVSPAQAVKNVKNYYGIDYWTDQSYRVEVWVEKDALSGVVGRVAGEYNCAYFACKGYPSVSELWSASLRLNRYMRANQEVLILHLGDHDPSGIDMTRDIEDRLDIFGCYPEIRRIALNMDQVRIYDPPPNPAKLTDSRYEGYVEQFDTLDSWELDALDPSVLHDLIESHITAVIDWSKWADSETRENREREQLETLADRWEDVVDYMDGNVHGNHELAAENAYLKEALDGALDFYERQGWDG